MAKLYLTREGGEIVRRRRLVPAGQLVEAWQDLYVAGDFWLGEGSRALLDSVGEPLPIKLALDGGAVPIYYGPRLQNVESLPLEESLQTRVLSAHGIAVAWITIDQFGERTVYEPAGPADPIFFLRRPAGTAAHIWRLFRTRREAHAYMAEYFGKDSEGRDWSEGLPVETYDELLAKHAQRA